MIPGIGMIASGFQALPRKPLLLIGIVAAIGGYIWWQDSRIEGLKADVRTEALNAADARASAAANEQAYRAAVAELERLEGVLAAREADASASKKQITKLREGISHAKETTEDAPVAPVVRSFLDGLRQQSGRDED